MVKIEFTRWATVARCLVAIAPLVISACSEDAADPNDGLTNAATGGAGGAPSVQGTGGAGTAAQATGNSGPGGTGGSPSSVGGRGGSGGSSGAGGSGGSSGSGGSAAGTGGMSAACAMDGGCGEEELPADTCVIKPITPELQDVHGEVYTRYASARGVPVLSTESPQDEALRRACMLLLDLGQEPKVLETMLKENIGLVVMGEDETSADFPEFAAWGVPDSRARGLGGTPRGLCAEENVMCNTSKDRWRGESICVHEFGHTMHLGVYNIMDSTFNSRVTAAYNAAMKAGKYANTYAASNATEYFGEGVQNWYNTNIESIPPNGVHNEINTRAELEDYDPELYAILAEVLPDEPGYKDCYYYE